MLRHQLRSDLPVSASAGLMSASAREALPVSASAGEGKSFVC